MKWALVGVAFLASGGFFAAFWSLHAPAVKLRRFCDEVRTGEARDAVLARARRVALPVDQYPAQGVILVWVRAFPGRTICSLSIQGDQVVRHELIDD